jgi:biopolymer transport protein ExbD
MKRRPMPGLQEHGVNVTPLIDIVMCMIIFFMLAAKIGVADGADRSIEIPVSILGKQLSKGGKLTINVRELNEQPYVTAMVDASTGTPVEIKLIDPATRKRPLLETLKRLRGNNDNFQVILRVDKDVSYASLAQVLETCSEARIKTQNFELRKPT